jgi:hypothetical protein
LTREPAKILACYLHVAPGTALLFQTANIVSRVMTAKRTVVVGGTRVMDGRNAREMLRNRFFLLTPSAQAAQAVGPTAALTG